MNDINELRKLAGLYIGLTAWSPVPPQELIELLDRLEAVEKERDDVAQQLVQSEQGKRKISEECDALRAKIAEMEQQEPVATIHINSITGNPSVDFIPGHRYLHHNSSLYALPGAKGE